MANRKIDIQKSKEILATLAKDFPKCFTLEKESKPLKIGIFQEIAEVYKETYSKTEIRAAIKVYINNWRYLYGCKPGAKRIDLEGNPVSDLEEEHIKFAQEKLKASKSIFSAKLKATAKNKKTFVRKPKKVEIKDFAIGDTVKFRLNNKVIVGTLLSKEGLNCRVRANNSMVLSIEIKSLF
ncbi:MAG: RNA chaperone ProQ [Psittacicella sp.]